MNAGSDSLQHFINDLDNGAECALMLMVSNFEELPIHQKVVLPHRGTWTG